MAKAKTPAKKPTAEKSKEKPKEQEAPKAPEKPKAVEAPKTPEKPRVDVAALDASRDHEKPDSPAEALCSHSERLAVTVRSRLERLSKGKVTARDAEQLEVLAAELRQRELVWLPFQTPISETELSEAREALKRGRKDLLSALRTFAAEDRATQATLDDLSDGRSDDNLAKDTDRMLAEAAKHEAALAETDVDAARIAEIAEARRVFGAVKAGKRSSKESQQESDKKADEAHQLRNRVFWALAALNRSVCARGKHVYRHEPDDEALFTAYTTDKKPSKPEPPAS